MKKVAILQHRLLHYRTGMFDKLRTACAERGIELILVHGGATRREKIKNDEGALPWAIQVKNKVWEIGQRDILWQPLPPQAKNADLIVIMQESRILSNYPLLLRRLWSSTKVAYWGHGKNFQSDAPTGIREKWKNLLLKQVDWWFAYTSSTTSLLQSAGYPENRVTQLNNAIDTSAFKNDLESCTPEDLADTRKSLGIEPDAQVGIFCGSLYPDKRLELLISASDRIRSKLPTYHLIVIGAGPSLGTLKSAAKTRPWLHLMGVQKGKDKARFFRISNVMLNPGLVGLHIVDAFCAGLVLATTDTAPHSPEISYLENGHNGLMVSDDEHSYADAIVHLFDHRPTLMALQENAKKSAELYTQDKMVDNFAKGLQKALHST